MGDELAAKISNVTVAVTGLVYSGQSTWNTNSGGNWGTITGTGQNAFGLNWGDNQGSPGLDPSYTNTDTATFGSALTSGTAVVNTNGANISLKSITFDNANGHYAIYQTNGSSFISLVGSGTSASAINVVAGRHAMHADVTMNSSMGVDIGAGSSLTFYNPISGGSSYSLTKTGAGTLYMNAFNSYSGNTVVNSGTLSGTGSVSGHVAVHNGGTLTAGSESAAYGVFTADSLSLDTGATASLSIGGTSAVTYDQIVTAGAIDFGNGNLTINFDNGGFGNSDVWQLFSGLSFTGNFAHVTAIGSYGALTLNWQGDGSGEWKATGGSLAAGQSMSFYVNNSSAFAGKFTAGQLVIVPEPSTMVFAGIGLTVLGWRQWRRRRSRVLGS